MEFIDLKTQLETIKDKLGARCNAVLSHGRYIQGPEVRELEEVLADFTGAKYAIGCGNGTDALMIALMAMDLGPGDEVITTPFTFYATAEVMVVLGIKPVFADIDPDTFNIDPSKIEEKITPRTKAILPVSLYGQCADMDAINGIASKHNLAVIEDGAQSFGAHYKGKKSCNLSTIGTTSFFPSKPLGCYGDGGMLFSSDEALAKKMRQLCNHGQDGRYNHVMNGLNSRLDTIQAAMLLAKIEIFPAEIAARERIGDLYNQKFAGRINTPKRTENIGHVYAQYTIRVGDREGLAHHLKSLNIPTAIHYPKPLHLQPAMAECGYHEGVFPNAEMVAKEVISLPMHPYLKEEDQDKIVEAVISFVSKNLQQKVAL